VNELFKSMSGQDLEKLAGEIQDERIRRAKDGMVNRLTAVIAAPESYKVDDILGLLKDARQAFIK